MIFDARAASIDFVPNQAQLILITSMHKNSHMHADDKYRGRHTRTYMRTHTHAPVRAYQRASAINGVIDVTEVPGGGQLQGYNWVYLCVFICVRNTITLLCFLLLLVLFLIFCCICIRSSHPKMSKCHTDHAHIDTYNTHATDKQVSWQRAQTFRHVQVRTSHLNHKLIIPAAAPCCSGCVSMLFACVW